MGKHLFVLSVRPVQTYIEQARRTQDLYAGSYLLSHLCRTAIQALNVPDEQILFPNPKAGQSLPNRCIALVEIPDGDDEHARLKALGEGVEAAVQQTFLKLAGQTIGPVLAETAVTWQDQIEQLLWVDWLFLPYQENEYASAYERLERLLQGIKQCHPFEQHPEKGRKCSLCGERNVKVYRQRDNERKTSLDKLIGSKLFTDNVRIVGESLPRPMKDKYLQVGEGLCAVCYMKRSAEQALPADYDGAFPSTANVALFDAIEALPEMQRPASYTAYDGELVLLSNDPSLLSKMDVNGVPTTIEPINERAFQEARRIARALQQHHIQYGPYYALLHFDGDFLGQWRSGEFLAEGEPLRPFQHRLSEKLGRFAQAAREYLQPPLGKCVYAGGDDFLGLVNLKYLFTVIENMHQMFTLLVNDALFAEHGFALRDQGRRLTFSAGIVAAHYKTPLSEVLTWANQMEQQAKARDSRRKNAFAIAVLKHSGEIHQTVFKWRDKDADNKDASVLQMFQDVITPIFAEQLSGKCLVNLALEFRRLIDPDGTVPFRAEILQPEVTRLVRRAYQLEGAGREAAVQAIVRPLIGLFLSSRQSFDNFLQALEVINFFTRRGRV